MAGSLEIFLYFPDSGKGNFLFRADESNLRALGYRPATPAAVTAANASSQVQRLPRRFRYIIVTGANAEGEVISRRIPVPTADNGHFNNGGVLTLPVWGGATNDTVEMVQFAVTAAIGESKRFANLTADTGLVDTTRTKA